jgi:hypothetical protein
VGDLAEVIQNGIDVCLTQQIAHLWAPEGILILQDQRDREGDLERTLTDL